MSTTETPEEDPLPKGEGVMPGEDAQPEKDKPKEDPQVERFSTIELQQGREQMMSDLRPQESFKVQLERWIRTLDAVAAHQRKIGLLQLYAIG